MDNKKLRKISKKELLEILLAQAKRIEALEENLNQTQQKLTAKEITIEKSGSLAEASLKLNGIFEAAQETVNQYIMNIKKKCHKLENDTKKECQLKKQKMLKETEKMCQKKQKEADEYLSSIKNRLKEQTQNNLDINSNKSSKENPKSNEVKNLTIKNKIVIEKSNKNLKERTISNHKKGTLIHE